MNRLPLILGLVAAGCFSNRDSDLASLQGLTARVNALADSNGGAWLAVRLEYDAVSPSVNDDCATLAVHATYNGKAFDEIELGHWEETAFSAHCEQPEFVLRDSDVPVGSAIIEISDPTATVTLAIPEMTANRAITFVPSTPTELHTSDTLLVGTALRQGDALAAGGIRILAADNHCSQPLVVLGVNATDGGHSYQIPDVLEREPRAYGCDFELARGTRIPVDVELSSYVGPSIATCDGVETCVAFIEHRQVVEMTFVP